MKLFSFTYQAALCNNYQHSEKSISLSQSSISMHGTSSKNTDESEDETDEEAVRWRQSLDDSDPTALNYLSQRPSSFIFVWKYFSSELAHE